MKRSEFREKVVMLLFINAIGGDFNEEDYSEEVVIQYHEVVSKMEIIDNVIMNNLVGYTIDRLNYVDLAIIRNSVYEMLYSDLPSEIIIDEAINLTKKYTNLDDDSAKRFNNRLLDTINKSLGR